jgi:hypothetical protein
LLEQDINRRSGLVLFPREFWTLIAGNRSFVMTEHSPEKWVEIYEKALAELEHAKTRGRIGNARDEIVARIQQLKSIPGLHETELQSIRDALNGLNFLEQLEDRFDEGQRRRVLERAKREIQYLAPTIKKLNDSASG